MTDQLIVFAVLIAAMALFILERWRYDLVAVLALLSLTVAGIIPGSEAFSGFGHPAVITVAAILVVSRGLANSGLVSRLSVLLERAGSSPTAQVGTLTLVVTVCSAFMNNVGALALLMPVALRTAQRHKLSPSLLLMPLAFGSLLGGMTTLIGTPPNIIIGTFRGVSGEGAFRMFDYTPVGLAVATVGVAFLSLVGWRLIPQRQAGGSAQEMFHIEDYTAELEVPADSPYAGETLAALRAASKVDFVAVGVVRDGAKRLAPFGRTVLQEGDRLIVEVDPEGLQELVDATGFKLAGAGDVGEEALRSEEVGLFEAVVLPRSLLAGRTAEELGLRAGHGVNLLAVARQGLRVPERLKGVRFEPGDVLLGQCLREHLPDTLATLGALPLAERQLRLGQRRRLLLATGLFAAAVAALVLQLLPAQTAFVAAAVAMIATRVVSLREAYRAIDWPVVVLLGAMIPVGGALETTGGAAMIAKQLAALAEVLPTSLVLGVLLLLAMFLSDIMNNAATAVLMAPIAVNVAQGLEVSPDPFLMAVAVGASCAFLTPIGHQSNTLVMGPGGYRFGDFWRLGAPLELLIAAIAVPMLLIVWPL